MDYPSETMCKIEVEEGTPHVGHGRPYGRSVGTWECSLERGHGLPHQAYENHDQSMHLIYEWGEYVIEEEAEL